MTLTIGNGYTGTFVITATVSDSLATASRSYVVTVPAISLPVILDNGTPAYSETGTWNTWGAGYGGSLRYNLSGSGGSASWQTGGVPAGDYTVQATWSGTADHSHDAAYQIYDGATLSQTVTVNQRQAPTGTAFGGVPFQNLATVHITSGTLRVVLLSASDGNVVPDAIRIEPVP